MSGEQFDKYGGAASSIYPPLETVACGEVIAGTVAAVMPTVECKIAYLRTAATNAGTVYIGGAGVTAANGTADATTGIPLEGGEQFGPLPIANLNQLYTIVSGTVAQRLMYLAIS